VRERTNRQKINGDKWKTGERKWETKRVDIDIVKEKTVNSKREEIKNDITNTGRDIMKIFLTWMKYARSKFYIQV
jgi:hypothetical protein